MTQETMIQQLTAHLPTYYSNKGRESAKKTKARCGITPLKISLSLYKKHPLMPIILCSLVTL